MKNVLFISAGCPYPLIDGGAIRIYQDMSFLKRMGYRVDLVYISHYDDDKVVREGLKNICDNIYRFHLSRFRSYWNVITGFLKNKKPMQVNYFYLPSVRSFIEKKQKEYDALFCITVRTVEYVKGLDNFKVIDFIDSIALNYERARHYKKGIWKYLYDIDYRLLSRYESSVIDLFNIRFVISEGDRDNILGGKSKNIDIVRNYYNIVPGREVLHQEGNHNIVFVGSMFYDPNVVAAVYFVKEVLPSLIEKYPDVRFYVVGNRPTKEVLRLASEHVVVTGYVEDVWPYLKNAGVVAVPMVSGAGLQNKLLEALSIRACIVTTLTGANGLVREEGAPFIASNTEEMISMISNCFEMSVEQRKEMAQKGYDYLIRNYSEEVVFDSFKKLFVGL